MRPLKKLKKVSPILISPNLLNKDESVGVSNQRFVECKHTCKDLQMLSRIDCACQLKNEIQALSKIKSAHNFQNVLTTIGISYPFESHATGGVGGGGGESTSHIPVTTH